MKKLVIVMSVVAMMSSCQHTARQEARQEAATADSLAREAQIQQAKQATIDSMRIAQLEEELAVKERESANRVTATQTTQSAPVVVQQRKGMSNTAKGALIGAGVGAATGALVSKKRGQGALIGGVVGAGGGAATGAVIDNRKKRRN